MSDNSQLTDAIGELRAKIQEMDARLESIQTELRPVIHIFRGNGRPGLEARLYHNEQKLDTLTQSTAWTARAAVGAGLSAIATIVWHFVTN